MHPVFSNLIVDHKRLLYAALNNQEEGQKMKAELLKEIKHEDTVTGWTNAQGDQVLRMFYPLNRDSVVFDVGGYKGQWAQDIYCMHGGCKMHIFEPITAFADIIRHKFRNNPDVQVHEFGLGRRTERVSMTALDDATTQYKGGPEHSQVLVKSVVQFMEETGLQDVDLMKLNIEGAEYDVLESLLDAGMAPRFKNIQIQFHNFIADAPGRRSVIQHRLAQTHKQTYNFDFVWENWERI